TASSLCFPRKAEIRPGEGSSRPVIHVHEKSGLNMLLKSLAIETKRLRPELIVAGLHPGTVDSPLSRPFSRRVAPEKLFNREQAADHLLKVVNILNSDHSGRTFAWDGSEIAP
ncbi:MAG: hypothetical protein OQK12_11670, partial [Motiliproteus sp.]|nr:hypothetical protein [Motiliproteus sp.]MCW9053771.1 hypothetical protein [Motiliproteus sp.]